MGDPDTWGCTIRWYVPHFFKTGALPERNLSAALFRLEASRGSAAVIGIVRTLIDWLQAPEQLGLRRPFTIWFGRVFLPKRLPGVELQPLSDIR